MLKQIYLKQAIQLGSYLAAVLLVNPLAFAQTPIYKWTDQRGAVHYSDSPPIGKKVRSVRKVTTYNDQPSQPSPAPAIAPTTNPAVVPTAPASESASSPASSSNLPPNAPVANPSAASAQQRIALPVITSDPTQGQLMPSMNGAGR